MKETVTRPYEFLVRWRDGAISGAHVGFEHAIVEDGATVGVIPLNVQPVAVGAESGFPLTDILQQVHIDALSGLATAEASCKEHEKTISSLKATIDAQAKEIAKLKA